MTATIRNGGSAPFRLMPDPDRLYETGPMRAALRALAAAAQAGEGIVVVTGEPGTGKTLAILRCLRVSSVATCTAEPSLPPFQLRAALAQVLGIHLDPAGDATVHRQMLQRALAAAGQQMMLCVDEAQALTSDCLEELRRLADMNEAGRGLLAVGLFGLPGLDTLLAGCEAGHRLRQRVVQRIELRALDRCELDGYVAYHLSAAPHTPRFDAVALNALYRASGGVPRLVNLLAARSVMTANDTACVTRAVVRAAAATIPAAREAGRRAERRPAAAWGARLAGWGMAACVAVAPASPVPEGGQVMVPVVQAAAGSHAPVLPGQPTQRHRRRQPVLVKRHRRAQRVAQVTSRPAARALPVLPPAAADVALPLAKAAAPPAAGSAGSPLPPGTIRITPDTDGTAGSVVPVSLSDTPTSSAGAADPGMLAGRAIAAKDYPDAERLLALSLREQPDRLDLAMALAHLQMDRNAPLDAWATLSGADAAGATDAGFLALKGAVCQRLGHLAEAAGYYRQALALTPQDGRWWTGLGLALADAGQVGGAQAAYGAALRDPDLPAPLRDFIVRHLSRGP